VRTGVCRMKDKQTGEEEKNGGATPNRWKGKTSLPRKVVCGVQKGGEVAGQEGERGNQKGLLTRFAPE